MIATITRPVIPAILPVCCINSRFGKYKAESEQPARQAAVSRCEILEQLKGAWAEFSRKYEPFPHPDLVYTLAAGLVGKVSFSPKDVELFSIALVEFQDEARFPEKAGTFLTVMINQGHGNDYVIHTKQLDEPLPYFGERNEKRITVKGGVGDGLGCEMKMGAIRVEGNVGTCAGFHMGGGIIKIMGNARGHVGDGMKGGIISVHGSAGRLVGDGMLGSEIHLNGDFESIGEIKKGRVYHKGKLIAGQPYL